MKTAAIDTATELLNIALEVDERRYCVSLDIGLRHSESLIPALDGLLRLAGTDRSLDLLVCMRGPGSFTGLRIGMATVKGLASALGCPFVAVATLDVLASGMEFSPGAVVPVLDAKKGRVFAAVYSGGKKESGDLDIPPEALVRLLSTRESVLFTGSGAPLLADHLASHPGWRIDRRRSVGAALALLDLGKERLAASGGEPEDLGPLYLRPSEAEPGG